MPSPEASLVVIACPHCGTRYQLAYEAIGAKGRTVGCAHCGQSWEAHADRPRPAPVPTPTAVPVPVPTPATAPADSKLMELAETALDEKFRQEEQRQRERRAARNRLPASAGDEAALAADHQRTLDEVKAAVAGGGPDKPSPTDHRRQQREFSQRQKSLYSSLPQAKARRLLRFAALAAVTLVFGGGLLFRDAIVAQFPQLAATYAAIGLQINVVGLEFSDLSTVKSLDEGNEVLVVDGKIANVEGHQVTVPRVIVTLTDKAGAPLYEWSMTPRATELEPGEVVSFETRLASPPPAATGVRLRFADADAQDKPAPPPAAAAMDDSAPPGEDATNGTTAGGA